MTPRAKMLARARGYEMLARLLLHGGRRVDPTALSVISDAPSDHDHHHDHDELCSQYVTAFDLGVPPYASVFLEPTGRVGGSVTLAVSDDIAGAGLLPVTDEVGACHVGVMLGHMGRLCRRGRGEEAGKFAHRHVLGWLPAYAAAFEELGVAFWSAVVQVVLDVVSEHVRSIAMTPDAPVPAVSPDHPLVDPASGLREVAAHLACPARCGLFLTDTECGRIGRALELPRGFGHRRARIETMLRTAAEYDTLVPLCQALGEVVERRAARLQALARDRFDARELVAWTARLDATQRMLVTLEQGASSLQSSAAGPATESR